MGHIKGTHEIVEEADRWEIDKDGYLWGRIEGFWHKTKIKVDKPEEE